MLNKQKEQSYNQINTNKLNSFSFSNSMNNSNLEICTLDEIIDTIKSSKGLKNIITKIHSAADKDQRRAIKQTELPYFTPGIFKNNHRKADKLQSIQFMIFDIDGLDNSEISILKDALKKDSRVYMYFLSPSGNGFKVMCPLSETVTDHNNYTVTYKHHAAILENNWKVNLDPSCKDASRACFFSHDPDLYLNEDAEPLEVISEDVKTDELEIEETEPIYSPSLLGKGINLKKIGNENKLKFLPAAVKQLSNEKIGRENWIICGFALAGLGEKGREYWRELSNNPNYPDTPEFIEEKFDELLNSSDGKVTLASLFEIAKEFGFDYSEPVEEKPKKDKRPFHEELLEIFASDDNRNPNLPLGFQLNKFSELCEHMDGVQPGFYFIGAGTNIGKTALMTNITLDALDSNADLKVLYYSLDDTKKYTVYRFISIISGIHINNIKKPKLLNLSGERNKLESARKYILNLVETERLVIKDLSDIQHIDECLKDIEDFGNHDNLIVFIDGLYNLEVSSDKAEGIRTENIERANRVKLIVDSFGLPIIATGELRKKTANQGKNSKPTIDDLMESGKFAYNASLVLLLSADKVDDLKSDKPVINIEFTKNKLSDFKGTQKVEFVRACGTINEISQQLTSSTGGAAANGF